MIENFPTSFGTSKTDPVDQYLAVLQQTKDYMDKTVPRLEAGINQIMTSGVPNGFSLNGIIDSQLGSNRGMAKFGPPNIPSAKKGNEDYVKSLIASSLSPQAMPQPSGPSAIRRIGFASGPAQNNFDRYYNHSQYKNLGWSPYADNETIYNQNSSWTDDFGRAASQWPKLVGLGFKQTLSNWDDLFSLNTSGDTKNAREMNRLMSIANSTRGGVGGFFVNQVANSGYTIGVASEIVLEELALFLGTAVTEGVLAAPALARTAANIKRLFGTARAAENAADAVKVASKTIDETLKTTSTALNSVQDISQARKFWNGVGGFFNPFEETVKAYKSLKTGANGFDKMTDFAKNAKVFGAFYRDVRLANTALAESRLEGGFVQNEMFDELMAEHYKNNVEPPDEEKTNHILTQAKLAGTRNTMANMPAILFSNKIVFEKALNGFSPFRDAGKGSLGTLVSSTVKKEGVKRKLYEGFIDRANPKTWFTTKTLKYFGQQFLPKNLSKRGLRYMSANFAEGLQEVYQEGMAETMKNYYLDTYFGPERAGTGTFLTHLNEGFGKQLSPEGAEVFMSGFLMGGIVQPVQTIAFQSLPQAVVDYRNRKKDPEAFKKTMAERKEAQDKIINTLNALAESPKEAYDKIFYNLKAQKDFSELMERAENSGDKKTHEDLKQDSIFEHVVSLLQNGYIDVFTDQVNSFKNLSDEELLQAFGYSEKDGVKDEFNKSMRERLDSIENKVNEIKSRYEKYNSLQNPYDKNDPDQMFDYMAFEQTKKLVVYNEYTFNKATERQAGILQKLASFAGDVQSGRITSALNTQQLIREIDILKNEIQGYEGGNAEELKIKNQKEKQLTALENLKNTVSNYTAALNDANRSFNPEVVKEVQKTREVKKNIAVGTEVEYKAKKGKITGKVISIRGKQVVIEYVENGKIKTKTVSINAKTLVPVGLNIDQLELEFDETAPTTELEEMKDELEKDLREYLSSVTGLDANDARLQPAVYDMIDYYELDLDAETAMSKVNILNDPNYFLTFGQMNSKAMRDAYAIAQRKMQASFEEFKQRMVTNEIAKELFYKFQVFINPEEMDALQKGEKMPTVFYDASNPNAITEIDVTSGKYRDIVNYLADFEAVNNFELAGKIIPEQQTDIVGKFVRGEGKSLRAIMTDIGLDPANKESQTVKLIDLLNYIIKTTKKKDPAVRLAQLLAGVIDPTETVQVNQGEPLPFSYTKESGIIIDPRYASSDYDEQQLTFDYLILNPLVQKITSDGLSDPAFSTAIKNVMDTVAKHREDNKNTLTEKENVLYSSMLSSPENFVSMAITLPAAQAALEQIEYKSTNKNVWTQLLDEIKAFLSKFLKIEDTDTALAEVMAIFSTKATGSQIVTQEEKVNLAAGQTKIKEPTVETPVNEMPGDLQSLLNYAYNNAKQTSGSNSVQLDFEKWIKNSAEAVKIINDWVSRNQNIIIQEEKVAPQEKEKKKEIIFEDLQEGAILRMIDSIKYPLKNQATVVSVNTENKTVTVKPTGSEEEYVISSEDLEKEIKMIIKPGVKKIETGPIEVTEEEKDFSNQNTDNVTEEENIDSDIDTAEEKDAENRNNDFINSLGCK